MYEEQLDSPIGPLLIQATDYGITKIGFDSVKGHGVGNHITKKCKQQLSQYFAKERTHFDIQLLPEGTEFQKKVWHQLQTIHFGKTISYSDLAVALGDIKTIRAAGTANGKNPIPIIIPCHRVIGKDGSMVGFSGGLEKKEWLLQHEDAIKGIQMKIFT